MNHMILTSINLAHRVKGGGPSRAPFTKINVNRQIKAMLIVGVLNDCCMHNETTGNGNSLLTNNLFI